MYNKTGSGGYKGGGKGGYKGGKSFGGGGGAWKRGGDERPAMHPATCSVCGASCEVPFIPNGKKPILCRNCFKKSEGEDTRFERPRPAGKSSYVSTPRSGTEGIEKQLKALNEKMDMILEALMEPEEGDDEEEGDEDEEEDEAAETKE